MTSKQIGAQLVALCKAGKDREAIEQLYADGVVSIEAGAPPGKSPEVIGKAAVLAKLDGFDRDNQVHGMKVEGPFPHGDRFAVIFDIDFTRRADDQRIALREVALYTVAADRIVREEFFYSMG